VGRGAIDCGEDGLLGRGVAQLDPAGGARGRRRPGATSADAERLQQLERENRELRCANEILRKASAYFAQAELDRRRT
jgi:transposase-like protein